MKLRVLVPRYRAQEWVFIPILIRAAWVSIHGLMLSGAMAAELVRGHVLPALSDYTRARRPSYSTSASSAVNASKHVRWKAHLFINSLLAHQKPGILLTSPGDRTKIIIIWLCSKMEWFRVIARCKEDYFACHCEPRRGKAIPYEKVRLPRFACNGRLPRFLRSLAMTDVLGNATFYSI